MSDIGKNILTRCSGQKGDFHASHVSSSVQGKPSKTILRLVTPGIEPNCEVLSRDALPLSKKSQMVTNYVCIIVYNCVYIYIYRDRVRFSAPWHCAV